MSRFHPENHIAFEDAAWDCHLDCTRGRAGWHRVKELGFRSGNWLSAEQSSEVLKHAWGTCLYVISEHPTVVRLGSGPSFAMKGNGQLASFTVYAPHHGNRIAFAHKDDSTVVWQIVATNGYFKGTTVGGLVIQYGKVPPGYSQLVPNESLVAPILPDGLVYSFSAETTNAPGAGGYFYMDEKGPILTFIPDLCLTLKDGREVRVKCSFVGDRTYKEPTNLGELVRKYQLRDTSESEKLIEDQFCEPTNKESKWRAVAMRIRQLAKYPHYTQNP